VIAAAKRVLPEITYTVHRGRGWAKMISETGSMQVGIGGIDVKDEPKFREAVQVLSGNVNDLAQPNTLLVFQNQAEKLDLKVGDAVTISAATSRGTNNTIDLKVVAIARSIGLLSMWNVYIPSQSLRKLYQLNDDATGAVHLFFNDRDLDHLPQLAAKLRTGLEKEGFRVMTADPRAFWMKFQSVNREDWTGQKLDVTTWEDEVSFMTWTLKALQWISTVLLLILVAIVVVGIMNTMWIAIRERTREIGTLRAIGMQRGSVRWMFLLESLLLGLFGTISGAIVGGLIAAAVNGAHIAVPLSVQLFLMSDHLQLAVHPSLLVSAVVIITGVTALAALYPSQRAARLLPVTAMQHFG
jgi:ABC-type lipoprotein release transport system permease subunit